MYKIEKGILPPTVRDRNKGRKYPWVEMSVGDSFFAAVPSGKKAERFQTALLSSARGYGHRHNGEQFTTKVAIEDDIEGVRVWRIE